MGGEACAAFVFAEQYTHRFTATRVRVSAFVTGVQNSEEFAEGKHAEQARSA